MLSKREQKFISSLKVKKYRIRENRFLVEGEKNVEELLHSDYIIDMIMGTHDFFKKNERLLTSFRFEEVDKRLLTSLGSYKTNDNAIAVAHMKDNYTYEGIEDDYLFVLDKIKDPGNLGTIIRTLDWFGFHQLVCSKDTADMYNPKVISATMGSFTRVRVCYTDLPAFLSTLQMPIFGACMEGSLLSELAIHENPIAIVMGSESEGISSSVLRAITDKLTILRHGKAESLNVGIATGIIANYLRMSK